ncbi:MAG: hypothetical protein ABSA40_02320 [Candidatus Dormibacteria bacterium]|jgi:hypothetical protein
MTSSAGRLLPALIAIALLAAGCGGPGPGLGQTSAVRSAEVDAQQASSTPVTFVSATSGPFIEFEPDAKGAVDPGREVWVVVFRGTFPPVSCGPAAIPPATEGPCPAPNTTMQVVIDYVTGQLILSQTPAGSG